ncbi:hypothetical protein [Cobetia amphilecti]|uniref:hypothetical protein n=1 Tax=Cobetia amphilecti TaxID=1055104 RepID=UPI001C088B17|nr:hypothetical protein [Cobetia amphilecti]MBU3007658.1 hypothetical protein [Cobetia amphilecti]
MNLLNNVYFYGLIGTIRNWQLSNYQWVTKRADLVIEGFPRSANTYLHRIVRAATGNKLSIGNHVHRPQQVSVAINHGIPVFVIFRHPLECISSYLVREPGLKVDSCINDYINFANHVLQYKNDPLLCIFTFEQVINAPIAVTSTIIKKIGEDAIITDELISKATLDTRVQSSRSSLPNAKKEELKLKYLKEIQNHSSFQVAVNLFKLAEEARCEL